MWALPASVPQPLSASTVSKPPVARRTSALSHHSERLLKASAFAAEVSTV